MHICVWILGKEERFRPAEVHNRSDFEGRVSIHRPLLRSGAIDGPSRCAEGLHLHSYYRAPRVWLGSTIADYV